MGQKRDRVEESDDEMSAVSDEFAPTPSKCVKISNCEDSFNDGVLHKLFGAALASRIAHEGVTWAVSREGLKFAGFGWVRFATVEHARRATEFDVMGPRAKEGREHNEGNDLFIAFHHDEIPDGRCGHCGKDGHYARECLKRLDSNKRPRHE